MADRIITYPGAIPLDTDILNTNKFSMTAIGMALQAVLGGSTWVDGLTCTPTSPASLQVLVSQGSIYSVGNIDGTAYGSLGSDTAHQIVKQGISLGNTTFTITVPSTTGQSINYLIQGEYQDVDGGSTVLPYYNASNPAVAYNGPANAGTSQNTVRKGSCVLSLKAGSSATTGTQVTPTPDAGFTGLWVVTVANGATTIVSGNITPYSGATAATGSVAAWSGPRIIEKLNDKVSVATGDLRWQPIGGGSGRTRLTNDLTLHVAPSGATPAGNDSTGDGSSGAPWLTTQKALDVLVKSYDLAGFNVTLQHEDSTTYPAFSLNKPLTGGGPQNLIIQGNVSTPSNVIFTTASAGTTVGSTGYGNGFTIQYCKVTSTTTLGQGICALNGATIYMGPGMVIGACPLYQIRAALGARVIINYSYTINGAAANHYASDGSGSIIFLGPSITITISGTPAYSDCFALIQQVGELYVSVPNPTFSGSATGLNFKSQINGTIVTGGALTSYLPGNSSGTATADSVYA